MLKQFHALLLSSLFSFCSLAFGADGIWTNGGGGNWSDTGKWLGGIEANGAGSVASINVNIGVDTHVITLNVARAVGTLAFSDNSSQLNDWTLSDAGNSANILTLTNTTAATPLIISSNRTSFLNVTLAGGQGLVLDSKNLVSPNYGLTLGRLNTYSGVTTIRKGEIRITTNAPAGAPGAFGQDTSAIQIGDANTLPTDILGLHLEKFVTLERDIEVNNYGSNVTIGAIADTSAYNRWFKGAIKLNRSITLSNGTNGKSIMESLISGPGGITINTYASAQSTIDFYNTNTYSGATVISRGVVTIYTNAPNGENGALGSATSDVILGDADTGNILISLQVDPGVTFGRNVWVKDVGSSARVSLGVRTTVPSAFFTGNIRTDRMLSLAATATGRAVFSGVISGTGSVEVTSSGLIVLDNTNTFTGDFYHPIGNAGVYFGRDVFSGQPSPFGCSTNPFYFTGPGGNVHYLLVTNTVTFDRPIRVAEGVRTQLGVDKGYVFPEYSGEISYSGDLALYSVDNSQLRISGRLTTQTNSLSVAGNSSSGCYIILSNPSNQITGTVSIGQASRLVVENSGALNGAAQIVYSAAGGQNPSGLFAGNGVTITQAVRMPLTAYYAAGTIVEIGMRTNGEAIFSGPVNLIRTNTTQLFTFTAPSGGVARFTAPVTGFFTPRKSGLGTVAFEGANNWTNDSEIAAGTLRAVDGQGLPTTSRLILNGGVLESTGTFTRSLGFGSGQVFWYANNAGYGGFSAKGGKLTVDLNNNGRDNFVWGGTPGFVSNAVQQLRFGSPFADSEVEFIENIGLTGGQYANIFVYDNTNSRSDKATLSGIVSGTTPFYKYGPGVLALNATNTLTGNILCSNGTLLVNGELPSTASALTVNNGAFIGGSGTIRTKTVTMAPGSGFDWGDAPGNLTITNSFAFPTNGVFRFVYGAAGTPRVTSGNKLTLPDNATVEIVQLDGFPPLSAVILASANTVGSPTNWTIANNTLKFEVVKLGNDVILRRSSTGSLIIVH